MRGYQSLRDESAQDPAYAERMRHASDDHSGERSSLQSFGSRRRPTENHCRKIVLTVASTAALVTVAVLLGLSSSYINRKQQQQLQQQQRERHQQQHQRQEDQDLEASTGPFDLYPEYSRPSVSVYESCMYTGASLDQQDLYSPTGLKEDCVPSGDGQADGHYHHHHHHESAEGEGTICPGKGQGTVVVESSEKLQEMLGFGGALTDAATINFFKLPPEVQDKVMDAYFGPDGNEYTVGRIPMGSCDFSVKQYSFDDVPGDYNLSHFDTGVEEDAEQRIPMIHEALKRQNLKLFISPWSPPKWMKTPVNGVQSMIESAMPEGLCADPRVHAAWALFFSKFITAYKEQGIDIWGVTVQNESENPGPWEACVYTPTSQADFIRDHLGPVLREDHPDVKIMPFDHNRDHLMTWAEEMMRDEETAKYVDGMAFHWYFGGSQRLLDGSIGWNALDRTHHTLDDGKFILSTESCHCPGVERDLSIAWSRAERTAHDIIADINSWSIGWVDWNLLLDYHGGPNHAGNLCDSPIICNEDHTDVFFQPMFYFIGHVSKFAKTGARRLKSHVTGLYRAGGMTYSGAVPGYEAMTYGCEGSVRQRWELTDTGMISLADHYGAQYDWFLPMCISATNAKSTQSAYLAPCDSSQAGVFLHDPETGRLILQANTIYSSSDDDYPPIAPGAGAGPGEGEEFSSASTSSPTPSSTYYNTENAAELCLDILDGSTEAGAVLTLRVCSGKLDVKETQKWEFIAMVEEGGAGNGEIGNGSSLVSAATGQCVTAGLPFFTGAAFEMNQASKERHGKDFAVVVLNEAEEAVEFDISFPSEGFAFKAAIGPRSIQTILA